ncbi:MAG: HAD family hydrolase [Candidatus Bipolaricaulota bacterium]|nr:HAD family hydrolase [Candidatus Bipolaricaulota bacterium]
MRACDATHIAFDLDFTLSTYPLTTAQVIAEVFVRCGLDAKAFGSAEDLAPDYDRLWRKLEIGATSADELRRMIWTRLVHGRNLSTTLAAPIARAYGDVRRESGVRFVEGAPEALEALRRRGYRLGLLTNGLSEVQWDKIRVLDLPRRLDAIVVGGDIGCYKPDERAFAALLARLGARPAEVLFVGDSYDADVIGAHNVGMQTAWVSADGADRPGTVIPDYVLASAAEVVEILP